MTVRVSGSSLQSQEIMKYLVVDNVERAVRGLRLRSVSSRRMRLVSIGSRVGRQEGCITMSLNLVNWRCPRLTFELQPVSIPTDVPWLLD